MPYYRHKQRHNPHINAPVLTPEKVERLLGQQVTKNPPTPLSGGAAEARENLEKLKGEAMPDLNTALRTALDNSKRAALTETLNAWDKDEKETQLVKPLTTQKADVFEITNNMSRDTFEFVKANPGLTSAQIAEKLSTYKRSSIHSLVAQFITQKQFTRDSDGNIYVLVENYKPLVSRKKWAKLNNEVYTPVSHEQRRNERLRKLKAEAQQIKLKRAEAKAAAQAAVKPAHNANGVGIGALPVKEEASAGVTSILINRNWTAQGVVDKLTVVQARQLYDVLKNIFGG